MTDRRRERREAKAGLRAFVRRVADPVRGKGWRHADDADFESRLVWLFGSPRSGSTWLLKLLGEQPGIATVNEPLIGEHLGPFMSDQPGIAAADLDESNFTLNRLRSEASVYFFAERYRHVWMPILGNLIRERFRAHVAHREGTRFVVIKEPHGSQAADMILAAVPRSRLLFLLRDGRDVVDSELAAFSQGSWLSEAFGVVSGIGPQERLKLAEDAAHKWLWRTLAVEGAFARHQGPKHVVRYEELRADPEGHLTSLVGWLGLDLDPDYVARSVARLSFESIPEAQRGPNKIFRSAAPGAWRANLTVAEQGCVERIIGPKLRELGYE